MTNFVVVLSVGVKRVICIYVPQLKPPLDWLKVVLPAGVVLTLVLLNEFKKPHLFLIFSQSDYLIKVVDKASYIGWLGGAKVSCIFCHRGVQLILAYSWARPAILVAGKGREVMFLFLLFLHFHSCSSFFPVLLFHLFCYLFCLFSPFLWETTQNDPQGLTCR